MATLSELHTLGATNVLIDKITSAVAIQAEVVRLEDPATNNHDNRLKWARQVFTGPRAVAQQMLWAVLAQNAAATVQQITDATDAAIKTAVANAVDVFATGD